MIEIGENLTNTIVFVSFTITLCTLFYSMTK